MKNYIFYFLFFTCCSSTLAQVTFEKKFSPDNQQYGRSIFNASNNGFLIQGTIDKNWRNCYLIRTDALGDTLWTRHFGTDSIQYFAYDMIQLSDGNFLHCGDYQTALTFSSMDSYIQKIDSLGNEIWFNAFGWPMSLGGSKDHGQRVKTLSDGSIIVAGTTKDLYLGLGNIINLNTWNSFLAKIDSNGILVDINNIHQLIYNSPIQFYQSFDLETIHNSIFCLGTNSTPTYPTSGQTILAKFDSNLDTVFTIDTGLNSYCGLARSTDDYLYLYGAGIITKMDTLGNVIWTTTNPSPSIPNDLIELANGDIVTIGGNYYISPFHADFYSPANTTVYINKYNNSGTLIGSSQINNPAGINKQVGYRIIETADQGFAFTGLSDDDIWLVKTDSLGQLSTSISENNLENKFSIYPNPANASCHFSFDKEIASVTLTSLDGKILFADDVNQKQGILNLDKLLQGIYFVIAQLKDGQKLTNKLLVYRP